MFLAHFVGDVHQPLHVSFEEDEGGNTIMVHWYRRKANLHHVCRPATFHSISTKHFTVQLQTLVLTTHVL